MVKQLLEDGRVTAKLMLMEDRRSAGWLFCEPIKKGKQGRQSPTPHVTAAFRCQAGFSFVQQEMSGSEEIPRAEQKTNFALNAGRKQNTSMVKN